jgi:hypothetical protein
VAAKSDVCGIEFTTDDDDANQNKKFFFLNVVISILHRNSYGTYDSFIHSFPVWPMPVRLSSTLFFHDAELKNGFEANFCDWFSACSVEYH